MNKNKKISFDIIYMAAVYGNREKIKEILEFYDGYISKLSTCKMYDDYGNIHMVIDGELKGRIQNAVISMILKFKIAIV
jgi:hypothetical protein